MRNGEVVIPDSVKIIGSCAFSCCYADKIILGSSVEEIGVVAFQNNYCESYVIPPSVRVIGGGAFASNPYLLSVCFEGDKPQVEVPIYQGSDFATTYVKSGSLGWGDLPASWLIDVTRPDADEFARPLKVWENYPEVPKDCQVDFAYEVNHDGSVTITGCPDGKLPPRLHIPESIDGRTVTGIADFAFSGCGYSFDELVIPATVETIGYGAFYDCWISSLAVPSCVIRLPDSFMCQDSLHELAFTDDREIIDDYFAAYFYNLQVVKFPEGVTSIGCAAFAGCNLSVLELPDGIKTIGDRAFESLQHLVKVTIPSSVEYLGRGVFGECLMLYEVEILSCVRNWFSAFFSCRNVVRATVPGFTGDYAYTQGSIGECFPNLRELKILEGTKGLWPSMCRNLHSLGSVELPSTLTMIMDGTFYNCYSMTNVQIKGVTTVIGREAFERCTSLTSIELKEGLKEVGDYAFAECTNLERADLPMSVEQLGYNVFYGCNKLIIDNLYIPGSVQYVNSWIYAGMKGIRSVTIGEGVYAIDSSAFEGCSGITNVFLPDSLERIDWFAFRDCTGLSEITIPENVEWIGPEAFQGCTNLSEVTLMCGCIPFSGSFMGCVNLKTLNINVPESGTGGGGGYLMSGDFGGNLLDVNILEGAKKLPDEYLVHFDFMRELNLPEGLEVVGKRAVQFCQNLHSVSLPSTLLEIRDNAFEGCCLESLQLPDGLQVIGDYAFCRALHTQTPIRIPSTVNYIGVHAFDGIELSMLDFGTDNPNYVVDNGVLYQLEDGVKFGIVMADKSLAGQFVCPETVKVIGDSAFEGCVGITSFVLPEGLEVIGEWAFYGCTRVASLNIPKSVHVLPGSAIRSVDFDAISIAEGNETYRKVGPYIYRRIAIDAEELAGADRDCTGDFPVFDGLLAIGDYAFYGCTNLTSVSLTTPIRIVGKAAFSGCSSLRRLYFGDSVTAIESDAFDGCVSIEELVVPSSVMNVGIRSFNGCTGLRTARLSCREICNYAFIGCTSLETLEVDDDVWAIGEYAFWQCTNLNSVVIGSGLEVVGTSAFNGCDSLRCVKIGSGEIGNYAFEYCHSLSDIELGPGVSKICVGAFYHCTNLVSVVIPEGVSEIKNGAFNYCSSLRDVSILGGAIERDVFTGCDRLENLYIGVGVTKIHDSFLSNANGFRSVTIDSHAALGSRAFYYNFSLESAAVSSETIGDNAFYQCESLSTVKLRDSVTKIGDWSFVGCKSLGEIVIPASVADLGYNSFGDCVGLSCVSFCGAPPRSIVDSRILKYANSVRYPRQYAAEYAPYVTEDQFAGFSDPEPPVITPGDGTVFDSSLTVNITAPDPLAKIHVTTNGTDPTVDSPIMRRFRVYGKTTVKAIAVTDDAAMPSMVTTTHYAPGRAENPVFSVPDGTVVYERDFTVTISHRESDGVLRYTTDGSEPDETSAVYGGPISVPDSMTIKAKVFSEKFFDSDVVSVSLVREIAVVPMPEISAPDRSTFVGSLVEVSISCAKGGAVIHYTTDGTEPSDQSPVYAKPFKIFDTTVIKAFAKYSDWIDSPVASSTIEKVMGRGDYIGAPDSIFEDGEDEPWEVEHDIGLADGRSLRNGDVYPGGTSTLKTSVNGTGKVMFMWKTDTMEDVDLHDWNHVEFLVDGKEVARLDGELDEWRQVSHMIETSGDHVLEWRFVRPYDDSLSMADCAWVDSFVWIPNEVVAATVKTDTPVPYKWLDKYGLLGEFTPDDAALAPSGKYDASGRPLSVWEDYVTGTDPTNPESKFTATITIVEGEPVVTWSPKLTPEEAALRKYTTYGCSELGGEWYNTDDAPAEVKSQLRFFKVGVEMK